MKYLLRIRTRELLVFMILLMLLTCIINNSPYVGKVVIYPICRELSKESMVLSNIDLHVAGNGNFSIYHKSDDLEFINKISESAQRNIDYLEKDFGYLLNEKINIVIYSEYKDMENNMRLGQGNAAEGAYYNGIVGILGEKLYNAHGAYRDSLILHELTHYVVDHLTGGNFPIWFTEGIALHEEHKVYGIRWAYNKKYSQFYSAKQLEDEFYRLDEIKCYKQSYIIIEYMVDNFGMESIRNIIKELKSGKTMNQAVIKVLDMDLQELFARSIENLQF